MNRTALRHFAVTARRTLIGAVMQKVGAVTPAQPVTLAERIGSDGIERTAEEAAYRWFSRSIALRYMEVNGFLPAGAQLFTDKTALLCQCRMLHDLMPESFPQPEDWEVFLLPEELLGTDGIFTRMIAAIPEEDWREQVQIIGWLYQFYNTEPKDKVFADLKKNIKIAPEAIPSATQLFTPDWIVRWMVENSLGRIWAEGHGEPEHAGWDYRIAEPEQEASVREELDRLRVQYGSIRPEELRFLDPCMGTGHILVYAFDVLMQIYTSCGWTEQDAAAAILRHNLYGLDIDRRAYQLACFALMMQARQYAPDILTPEHQPHLACFADVTDVDAEALPAPLRAFAAQFRDADSYGSLLELYPPEGSGKLPPQLAKMQQICGILGQQYDVVCTNPPYMGAAGMHEKLSAFVKGRFPDSKSDLFACFIERCGQLTKSGGFYAMITMHSWMFLMRFEKLRRKLMQQDTVALLHMGAGAFEQSDVGTIVQTAAFTIRKTDIPDYLGCYADLTAAPNPERKRQLFLNDPTVYLRKKTAFQEVPGAALAYWASEHTLHLFAGKKLGDLAVPRQGMTTSDNDRFTRRWFEVAQERICFTATDCAAAQRSGRKWFPYNKGGGYRKWYGNHEYVVNFEDDGRELRAFHEILNKKSAGGRIKNREYYFRRCIAWTFIATTPGFRLCPEGFIFDVAGSSLFVEDALQNALTAYLCSNTARYFLRLVNPTMNIQAKDIRVLPYIEAETAEVDALAAENIRLCKEDWDSFEISWEFRQHPLL
ncbi:MAG: BREX-1 system adenine-specific DNA-methyltransferase PglX [Oscillospiraceae bacterium]|nr:BREX-1 system adenine-specific DNA-methyltransferase PglX [Oscillospiraceae bacterium]